jgi:hypothetical protein
MDGAGDALARFTRRPGNTIDAARHPNTHRQALEIATANDGRGRRDPRWRHCSPATTDRRYQKLQTRG